MTRRRHVGEQKDGAEKSTFRAVTVCPVRRGFILRSHVKFAMMVVKVESTLVLNGEHDLLSGEAHMIDLKFDHVSKRYRVQQATVEATALRPLRLSSLRPPASMSSHPCIRHRL
jgi:hypothetical protein